MSHIDHDFNYSKEIISLKLRLTWLGLNSFFYSVAINL